MRSLTQGFSEGGRPTWSPFTQGRLVEALATSLSLKETDDPAMITYWKTVLDAFANSTNDPFSGE